MADIGDIKVVIKPELDSDFRRDIERAAGQIEPEIPVKVDQDAWVKSLRDARTDVERQSKRNPIEVPAKVDQDALRRDMIGATRETEQYSRRNPIEFFSQLDTSQLSRQMAAATADVRKQSAAMGRNIASGVRTAQKGFTDLGRSSRQLGNDFLVGVTLPIVAGFATSAKSANDLNQKLREVNTLTGTVGSEAEKSFAQLKDGVTDLSNEFGVAQDTLTQGLYDSLSAGVPQDNVFEFLGTATQLSVAGVTDVGTAVDGLTTVMNAFKMPAEQAGLVSDQMFASMKLGKQTVDEIAGSLFQVAPSAAALGVEFSNVAAGMATLTKSGTPASVATTQLRQLMVETVKPSENLKAALDDLGVKSFGDLMKRSGSLQSSMQELFKQTGGNSEEFIRLFGSIEAGQAALGLTGDNAKVAAADLKQVEDAAGAVSKGFEEIDKNRGLDRFTTAIQNLRIAIGDHILPLLAPVGERLTEMVNRFGALAPDTQKFSLIIAGLAAAIGPLLIGFGFVAAAIGAVSLPVVAGVAAIAALIAGLVSMREELGLTGMSGDRIKTMLIDVKDRVLDFAATFREDILPQIVQFGRLMIDTFMEDILPGVKFFGESVVQLAKDIAPALKLVVDVVKALIPVLGPILGVLLTAVGVLLRGLGDVSRFITAVFGPIIETFTGDLSGIGDALSGLAGFITGLFAAIGNSSTVFVAFMGRLFVGVFRRIGNMIRNAAQLYIRLFTGLWKRIGTIIRNAVQLYIRTFTGFWKRIGTMFRTALHGVVLGFSGAWSMVTEGVRRFGSMIISFLSGVWTRLLTGVRRIVTGLRDAAQAAFRGFLDRARAIGESIITFVRNMAQSIVNAVLRLPERLLDIGKAIINGLLNGMKNAWENVKDWLKSRASEIVKLKGPVAYDATILVPAGKAVIGGFFEGLRDKWGTVRGWLSDLAPGIKSLISKGDAHKISADLLVGNIDGQSAFAQLQDLVPKVPYPSPNAADVARQAKMLEQMFNVGITSGLRPGAVTANGSLSQHGSGYAYDYGTSRATLAALDALTEYLRKFVGKALTQVIWRNLFWGPGGILGRDRYNQHGDHVHVGWMSGKGFGGKREHGGPVQAGKTYLVGEAGRELFVPNQNGRIVRNFETETVIKNGSGRGVTQNFNIQSNSVDPNIVAAIVASHNRAAARRVRSI